MRIIPIETQSSGAYYQICEYDTLPDGYYQVTDGVTLSCGGFGTLTVVDDIVTAFTPNEAAWTAWQTANPGPVALPSFESRLVTLEDMFIAQMLD